MSIDGHPELAASYLKDQKTIDPSGTGTEGFGALFGPMPPGAYSVSATVPGCTSTGFSDGYFSCAPSTTVVANTVTLVVLQLTP